MPRVRNQAKSHLCILLNRTLDTNKTESFPSSRLMELITFGVKTSDRFQAEAGGDGGCHQLPAELIVSSYTE